MMNAPAIYKNKTAPAPVEVVIVELLPSGGAWVRMPDGTYKRVKRNSLWKSKAGITYPEVPLSLEEVAS